MRPKPQARNPQPSTYSAQSLCLLRSKSVNEGVPRWQVQIDFGVWLSQEARTRRQPEQQDTAEKGNSDSHDILPNKLVRNNLGQRPAVTVQSNCGKCRGSATKLLEPVLPCSQLKVFVVWRGRGEFNYGETLPSN